MCFEANGLSMAVKSLDHHTGRALDLNHHVRNGKAALVKETQPVGLGDHRIHQFSQVAAATQFIVPVFFAGDTVPNRHRSHQDALGDTDLWSRQTNSGCRVHRLRHVIQEANNPRIDSRHGLCDLLENRLGDFVDGQNRHGPYIDPGRHGAKATDVEHSQTATEHCYRAAVLKPKSVTAHAPGLDRKVLRAIADRTGVWARTTSELAEAASHHYERNHLHWVPAPEDALCLSLLSMLQQPDTPIAVPAWGRRALGESARRHFPSIVWMDPKEGRLDPGEVEIKRALKQGAGALLLAPVAGDCSALVAAEKWCSKADIPFAVDARSSMGSRTPAGGPATFGDIILLPVDGDPGPSACPGAFLGTPEPLSNGAPLSGPGPAAALAQAVSALATSVRDEPRLRRLWPSTTGAPARSPGNLSSAPPGWACAAAHARLEEAEVRASQRGRHARSLRDHCGNLPAVTLVDESHGCPVTGGTFPLLAQSAREVAGFLQQEGLPTVSELGGWLAPEGERSERARQLDERALLLPLHPYFRPRDLRWMGEVLRRATLRANGTGQADPTQEGA